MKYSFKVLNPYKTANISCCIRAIARLTCIFITRTSACFLPRKMFFRPFRIFFSSLDNDSLLSSSTLSVSSPALPGSSSNRSAAESFSIARYKEMAALKSFALISSIRRLFVLHRQSDINVLGRDRLNFYRRFLTKYFAGYINTRMNNA